MLGWGAVGRETLQNEVRRDTQRYSCTCIALWKVVCWRCISFKHPSIIRGR